MGHRLIVLILTCTLLVACGGEQAGAVSSAQGDNGLPKPGAVNGSVTGMPNPGVASAPPAVMQAAANIGLPSPIEAGQGAAGVVALQSEFDSASTADALDPREAAVAMQVPAGAAPADATDVTDPGPLQQ